MDTTTIKPGFYGTDYATWYVTPTGRVWLIQSDDTDALPREVDALDDKAVAVRGEDCHDLDLTGCED